MLVATFFKCRTTLYIFITADSCSNSSCTRREPHARQLPFGLPPGHAILLKLIVARGYAAASKKNVAGGELTQDYPLRSAQPPPDGPDRAPCVQARADCSMRARRSVPSALAARRRAAAHAFAFEPHLRFRFRGGILGPAGPGPPRAAAGHPARERRASGLRPRRADLEFRCIMSHTASQLESRRSESPCETPTDRSLSTRRESPF
jgi:hypothetical protein